MNMPYQNDKPTPMNRHYLFYKHYFETYNNVNAVKAITEASYGKYKADVNRPCVPDVPGHLPKGRFYKKEFSMEVKYPGLLIGLGYPHDFGDLYGEDSAKEAIKLGFSLDYVTGLPYIPGSSIKGVLRSAFKKGADCVKPIAKTADKTLRELELEFFEGNDVFLDSYPLSVETSLLRLEAITPHSMGPYDQLAGLREPRPLKLLKVPSGVKFMFSFILSNGSINAEDKKDLFISIIEELGVGAKTNVGFGFLGRVR